MRATLAAAALAAAIAIGLPLSVQALPTAAPDLPIASGITPVAGGCGVGFHRGPYGGCRRNGWWHGRWWGRGRPWRHCYWRYGRRICRW